MHRRIYKTIFSRLMVTFLMIIIPIYLLGMTMNLLAMNVVKTEINQSMSAQIEYYLNDLEDSFENTKMLQYDCLNDENLNKLAILWRITSLYERQQSMIQLQNRLVTIRNSSPYIKDVTAYIVPINKSISANDGIVNFKESEFEEIRVLDDRKGAQLLFYDDDIYMTTYDNGLYGGGTSLFSIIIQFDKEKLIETLTLLTQNMDSEMILSIHSGLDTMYFRSDSSQSISIETIKKFIYEAEPGIINTVTHNHNDYYVAVSDSKYLDARLMKYVPEKLIMKPLRQIQVWFWIFSVASVLIFIIYSFSTYKYIHEPMTKLVKAFKKVEKGDLDVSIRHNLTDEFEYIYRRFNDMVAKIGTLIDQVYKQKIMTQRAELKHLQSQINPHFLYNSFFLINTMARIGDENLIVFTKKLGEYFRYVTHNGTDVISLSEEVEHAKVYMEIQKMRFSKRLTLSVSELPEEYETTKVPRLILQPIIENVFEYVIDKKREGRLLIDYVIDDQGLDIIFEDNGENVNDQLLTDLNELRNKCGQEDEMSGLKNIHRRIQLLFGESSGLTFARSRFGGLKVILRIVKNDNELIEEMM